MPYSAFSHPYLSSLTPRPFPENQPWPDGEAGPDQARPSGWDPEKLRQAIDQLLRMSSGLKFEVAEWWTFLIAYGVLLIQWLAYLLIMTTQPTGMTCFWGKAVTWPEIRSIWLWAAEVLMVYFETNPEIIRRLLPSPLQPTKFPGGAAFLANYPKTNFSLPYLESALFLLAEYKGEEGAYCLTMTVTDDMAMIGGRECFGYPKKIAEISIKRDGEKVEGWTERHGIRFFEVRARLTGKFNHPEWMGLTTTHALFEKWFNLGRNPWKWAKRS